MAQQLGVVLPNTSQAYNHDEVRTSSGLSCRQASGGPTTIEFGVLARDDEVDRDAFDPAFGEAVTQTGGAVYARVVHALGAPKRLDCSRIYELEVERLKAEIEMLRIEQQYSMGE